MQYAIFLNSVLPVRLEAKDSSEMVTQLLFGETCQILEETESFVKIENRADGYQGWVDRKMLTLLPLDKYTDLLTCSTFKTNAPIADVFCLSDKSIYHLSLGSTLPFFDIETNKFEIAEKTFQIHSSYVTYIPQSSKGQILPTAMLFLNTPYLWGGKNIMGIDCSGFVQIVYSLNGYNLPRDARDQERKGFRISSIDEAEASDLFFFEKDTKITHVGIYLGDNKIIHASGKVRIDRVDAKGVFNEETSSYTHKLCCIKRI